MLENIKSPSDIKNLSQKDLELLAGEIREKIISVVGNNGGHLASNLGVVELTIALHRVFNSPDDAIVWDVSHQCYAHKLLTGRYNQFETLRQKDGLSGFTNKNESQHDYFINGHSSTSISSALGLLTAWDLDNKKNKVVAVIGDGALTGGMAFEGLCNAGQLNKNLIVILNDNQMSIDHNTGSISRYLSSLTMTHKYQSFRYRIDRGIEHLVYKIPSFGKGVTKFVYRFKRSLKGLLLTNNLFTDLGFEYAGPFDGHDEQSLEKVLKRVKSLNKPVVVHVVTKKGKGFEPAEENPELFHGIGPFDNNSNQQKKLSFTDAFSKIIVEQAEINKKIVGITAAMAQGTGLSAFAKQFPDRFFDVGIAEEHAVTFASGLAAGGKLPVVCIYSTFLQRSYDQIIHDIVLQNLSCIFMLDRAGAVPHDGATHQGIFDISMLRPIPNIVILSPCSKNDLELCFKWAENANKAVAIRYPKLICPDEPDVEDYSKDVQIGKGLLIKNKSLPQNQNANILIVSTGGMFTEVMQAIKMAEENQLFCDLYSLRFIKPLDENYFFSLCENYESIIFVEDGIETGGISQYLQSILSENKKQKSIVMAFKENFYSHGSRNQVLEEAGLSPLDIFNKIKEVSEK
ncbi:MAG: 1-deoxy-D-xylulose-5-phosphate synthase [Treponema sp.]|nr:1-deoxy-D-xylulose-5-phosphate synthase [Treponema sp.]